MNKKKVYVHVECLQMVDVAFFHIYFSIFRIDKKKY